MFRYTFTQAQPRMDRIYDICDLLKYQFCSKKLNYIGLQDLTVKVDYISLNKLPKELGYVSQK